MTLVISLDRQQEEKGPLVVLGRKKSEGTHLPKSLLALIFNWAMCDPLEVNFSVLLLLMIWYSWMPESALESVSAVRIHPSSEVRREARTPSGATGQPGCIE